MLGNRAWVCSSTRKSVPWRSASFFLLPTSRARAVNHKVAVVPKTKAVEHFASHFGPNASLPKAKEELIAAVACQESTQTQGVTLKAEKTEAKSARCRGALHQGRSSVSRAFVRMRHEETKKGVEHYNSPLQSRKTRRAPQPRRWS